MMGGAGGDAGLLYGCPVSLRAQAVKAPQPAKGPPNRVHELIATQLSHCLRLPCVPRQVWTAHIKDFLL